MPRTVKYAEILVEWERMLAALEQNSEDFPDAGINREKLQSLLDSAKLIVTQQAQRTASKQEASQQLKAAISTGRKVATALRFLIKVRYGNRSEKLTEFYLQPFRSRTQPPQLPPTETTAPAGSSTPAEDLQ
jgi:hypothetical protein